MAVSGEALAGVAAQLDEKWWRQGTILDAAELACGGALPLAEITEKRIAGEPVAIESRSGPVPKPVADRVRRRVRLRVGLDLPKADCAVRRRGWLGRRSCACLTLTLDRLLDESEEEPDKATVLKAARRIHKPSPRKRKPKPQPETSTIEGAPIIVPEPLPSEPGPALDGRLVTQTPTKPLLPRYSTGREWHSQKSQRERSITWGFADKIF